MLLSSPAAPTKLFGRLWYVELVHSRAVAKQSRLASYAADMLVKPQYIGKVACLNERASEKNQSNDGHISIHCSPAE